MKQENWNLFMGNFVQVPLNGFKIQYVIQEEVQ